MERLRAAIEQARKTRADSAIEAQAAQDLNGFDPDVDDQPADTQESPSSPEEDLSALWSSLPEIELKKGRLRRNRLLVKGDAADQAPYDMLRTRLLTQMRKDGCRRVAVTSPSMSCGKTTTCANLALSMARQPDMRTLVIEADMRRPAMAKMFGASGEHSFFDVLTGNVDIVDQAQRIGSNVALSVNFGLVRNPTELLAQRQTSVVLDRIDEVLKPDLVIFDMPPMLSSDDTLAFLHNVDCAVLIALAEQTSLSDIDACETELAAHTRVAGVVLNRCRYSGGQYGYRYGD